MVLIVLRHGQSVWNKENKFTGWEDISLNEHGKKEALQAGKILKKYKFDHIITSDLKRTIETCDIIKNEFSSNDSSNIPNSYAHSALKERHYGDLTGKNKDELKELYGPAKIQLWRRSYSEKPPNGENLHDVKCRAGNYFDNEIYPLLKDGSKNILIIAHGNSLRALFVHLGIKDEVSVESFEISTGVPIQIDIENKTYWYENSYELKARQILDSRGFPTIEVNCIDKSTGKSVGKGASPSGSSCGSKEALEMRDGDMTIFQGKGVLNAIANVHALNKSLILNYNTVTNLKNIDEQLITLDSTDNKNIIGGNATTAVSFCMMNVGANLLEMEMYDYISTIYGFPSNKSSTSPIGLPTIMSNIINGGKHGQGGLKIQEFMIVPRSDIPMSKRVQMICETYYTLKKLLLKKYGHASTNIGDEGGFVVCGMKSTEEAMNIIDESITCSNYKVGEDIFIALDCASSEFYNEETKLYEIETDLFLTADQLVSYYGNLLDKYPSLKSIEDGFHETDYDAWKKFVELYSKRIMIVGDDLFCTNPKLIQQGIDDKWANSLLLKVNQIGTITEAIEGARKIFAENGNVIVSHRSGENNQEYIIDLAVGMGAKYVKIGACARGERVSKYNRLMEIELL